jgi:hypothetical protein
VPPPHSNSHFLQTSTQQVNSYVALPTVLLNRHDSHPVNSIDEEACMMNGFLLLEELRTEESERVVDLFVFERLPRVKG